MGNLGTPSHNSFVNLDNLELAPQSLKAAERGSMSRAGYPAHSYCLRQSSRSLHIQQLTRHYGISLIPHSPAELGARFGYEQRNQG